MQRFVILASVVVLGASTAACSGSIANPTSEIAPSMVTLAPLGESGPQSITAAARGGGKGNSSSTESGSASLALELVADANGDGASWGDTVRFTVTNPPPDPNVELLCSQNGTVVYSAMTGYYATSWPSTSDMVLSSRAWTGGAASCNARLYVFSGSKVVDLASYNFTTN